MSYELLAILSTSLFDMMALVAIVVLIYRNERWRDAYDAAILRRVNEIASRRA